MAQIERFHYTSNFSYSAQDLYTYHARPGALERLLPPWERTEIIHKTGSIDPGGRVELRLKLGPFPLTWIAHHIEAQPGKMFRDIQYKGPFAQFIHTHTFTDTPSGSMLEDSIRFKLPGGLLLPNFVNHQVKKLLQRNFTYREHVLREDMRLHQTYSQKPLTVLISGASGAVGKVLVPLLTTGGHRVFTLVRRIPDPQKNEIYWNPDTDEIDRTALIPPDAVIHLAGEYIGLSRWSEEKKRRVVESRIKGTRLLARTLASLEKKPKVFLSASAVGYYGDQGSRPVEEGVPAGKEFISTVCRDWEEATFPAEDAGIRTIHMRLGVGLTPRGGALQKIQQSSPLAYIRYFGSGQQYISWISLDDMAAAMLHCIQTPSLRGPINIAAPNPVTNRELIRQISRVTGRPRVHGLPGRILKMVYGDMASEILLGGCRVSVKKLTDSGFRFRHPDLFPMLQLLLGKQEEP